MHRCIREAPGIQTQGALQKCPVKSIPGIFFSSRRYVFVTRNVLDGVALNDGCTQACERFVLTIFKVVTFDALQFDADGVVVAVVPSQMAGDAGVPRPVIATDKLPEVAIAADIEVCRNLHTFDTFEVGVLVPVQLICEQALYVIAAILAWRKADGVKHDQINL